MKRYTWDGYIFGWGRRGTGYGPFDPADWEGPDGRRGIKRPPLVVIGIYLVLQLVGEWR